MTDIAKTKQMMRDHGYTVRAAENGGIYVMLGSQDDESRFSGPAYSNSVLAFTDPAEFVAFITGEVYQLDFVPCQLARLAEDDEST